MIEAPGEWQIVLAMVFAAIATVAMIGTGVRTNEPLRVVLKRWGSRLADAFWGLGKRSQWTLAASAMSVALRGNSTGRRLARGARAFHAVPSEAPQDSPSTVTTRA